jgi:hypothetical protein
MLLDKFECGHDLLPLAMVRVVQTTRVSPVSSPHSLPHTTFAFVHQMSSFNILQESGMLQHSVLAQHLQQTTIQSAHDPPIFGYFHDSAIECMNASNIQYQPPITSSHVLISLPTQLRPFLEFAISSCLSLSHSSMESWKRSHSRLYFTMLMHSRS